MDHLELYAIAQLYKSGKGSNASDEFKEGFVAGVHFMEILHEERLYPTEKSDD